MKDMALKQWHRAAEKVTNDRNIGRNCNKYNSEISTSTWLSPQYAKQQVLKFRLGKYVPPAPPPLPKRAALSESSRLTSPCSLCDSIPLSDTDTLPLLLPFLIFREPARVSVVCMSQRGLEKEMALNISKKYETQNYMHRDVQPFRP